MTAAPLRPDAPADSSVLDDGALGARLHARVADLAPLRRCLTGDGLRATLEHLAAHVPLTVIDLPSGTPVGDWTVPDAWTVREAYLALPDGRRVVDWADSALHLVQYSRPVRAAMTLAELRPHLHTRPDLPQAIPYRTAYHADTWGFCLAHDALEALAAALGEAGRLDVVIDADLAPGAMPLGEIVVPGTRAGTDAEREILLSAHACHPEMANDNASALAVASLAAEAWGARPRRHTLRVVVAPGTVGAIAWMHLRRDDALPRVAHGLVLANLGDAGPATYKRSRRGTLRYPLAVDRAVEVAARDLGQPLGVRPFTPDGYDERQYGSPGADLPVGRLTRTPHGEYPEYHTSADDLALVRPEALAASFRLLMAALDVLDGDARLVAAAGSDGRPRLGEPMLGRHGLYRTLGGEPTAPADQQALMWGLALADGDHTLLDAAERSGLPFAALRHAADRLLAAGLVRDADA